MNAAWRVGFQYFVIVFGFGFLFGVIRTMWAVPRFGERNAELLEIPLMILVISVAGPWAARRLDDTKQRLLAGAIGLGLMLSAEVWVVLRLRELSFQDYLAQRDPFAGSLYLLALLYFGLCPAMAGFRRRSGFEQRF